MTRVLVVYHDPDIADIEIDELRRAGYEVDRCAGPIGGEPCPVLRGEPCWQVEEADVLVYDTWDAAAGGDDLVADLRELHPDKPVVLTSSGPPIDRVAGTTPILHAPTRADLPAAIERALLEPMPPVPDRRKAGGYHGPRW